MTDLGTLGSSHPASHRARWQHQPEPEVRPDRVPRGDALELFQGCAAAGRHRGRWAPRPTGMRAVALATLEAGLRVLLSEASSLTAREHLSVLGPSGIQVDVASSSPLAIARFSRWCRRVIHVPCSADDPEGYLAAIAAALRDGRYDALLPTHEQAWLFAAGRHLLPADAPWRCRMSKRSIRYRASSPALGCCPRSGCRSRPGRFWPARMTPAGWNCRAGSRRRFPPLAAGFAM